MLNRNRGDNILELTERPSRLEKGVSLCREEPLLTSKKRPLHLQTIVFTPLSIRRGDGGEAVDGLLVRLLVVWGEAVLPILITIPYISKACILCYKKNIVNLQRTILLYHVRTYRHP